ncbi:MAG: hypothetical protein M5R36_14740 [Deltaproteobacteria bacterium]|nr:hypothetical protein [Deltaproteobacteria bacterium]
MTGYRALLDNAHENVARWINKNSKQNARIAIMGDPGLIGFRTRRPAVDFGALNDNYLSGGKRTPREIADYFFSQPFETAVANSFSWEELRGHPDTMVVARDPRFHCFDLIEKYRPHTGQNYFVFLYQRRPDCDESL